jgi:hypothetical protein
LSRDGGGQLGHDALEGGDQSAGDPAHLKLRVVGGDIGARPEPSLLGGPLVGERQGPRGLRKRAEGPTRDKG